MEGGPSKRKQYQPYEGSTMLRLVWGGSLLYFPGFGNLQPYEASKFRICSESVSGVFPDLFRILLRKCLTVLGATPSSTIFYGIIRTGLVFSVFGLVYFVSSLRGQTAKTLICTKSGVAADSRKSDEKCGEPPFLRIFCTLFAQKVRFSAFCGTFRHSFWNRRKPHFLCRLMFLPFGLWGSTRNPQLWAWQESFVRGQSGHNHSFPSCAFRFKWKAAFRDLSGTKTLRFIKR